MGILDKHKLSDEKYWKNQKGCGKWGVSFRPAMFIWPMVKK